MRNVNNLLLSAATLVCLASFNGTALGGQRVVGGEICSTFYASQAGSLNHNTYGSTNISGSAIWVTCPIVRDNVSNTTGTSGLWVYITASSSTDTTLCWNYSKGPSGNLIQGKSAWLTGSGWLSLDTSLGTSWGPYSVYCLLGPNDTLNATAQIEF